MNIVELVCPKCGAPVQHMVLLTYPPTDEYRCTKIGCDYYKTIRQEIITMKAPQ